MTSFSPRFMLPGLVAYVDALPWRVGELMKETRTGQ